MHSPQSSLGVAAASVLALCAAAWLLGRRRQKAVAATVTPLRSWPQGVEVRPSLIENAGEGLFAARCFAKGDVLGEYRGVVVSMMQRLKRDDDDTDYMMGGWGMNTFVDAKDCYEAAGRYVNHAFDPAQRNAYFQRHADEPWALLVATREIAAGEEIYASYSDDYWRARGIDPNTGLPAPPDGEIMEQLRIMKELRARARAPERAGTRGPLLLS